MPTFVSLEKKLPLATSESVCHLTLLDFNRNAAGLYQCFLHMKLQH